VQYLSKKTLTENKKMYVTRLVLKILATA